MTAQELYSEYKDITQKAADLQYVSAVLQWDQEVYMPPKGFSFRGRQLATLAAQAHEWLTSDRYGELLKRLADAPGLSEDEQDNVRLSLEDYEKGSKLPIDFIEKITQQTSDSYNAWIQARTENKFSLYEAELGKMVTLKKQQAAYYGYEQHPYNALLDDYEKGMTVGVLDPVFKKVGEQLPPLLARIKSAVQVDDTVMEGNYPRQPQWDFSMDVLKKMGYDLESGRQDISEHPFTTSFSPLDVRVTTRVDENNFASLLWSSIHEGGHALYEQGLPAEQYGLPLGAAASLSIHESQSRLWENCVGRSLHFWKFFYPVLQQYFPSQLRDVSADAFYKAMNKVEPSLIRTEADEITYHFHVMIRYEIEKALIQGEITVAELPGIWNEYYQKYLGLSSPDDKKGVLQDVHWSHGSFGYFPTYSLGSFYAAQFFEQAIKDLPDLQARIESGNLVPLLEWLRGKVHKHGRKYRSEELCNKITGKGLDFSSFMNYAENKYSGIYSL
jgi:carboxypeptidase Taq